MPIYQGGAEYAAIRQAKETQGQKQLDLNVARDQARVTVAQAWAQLEAAKSSIEFDPQQVKSAEAALNGVREEARLGQRTTLDVLNAQQELVNARIAMVVCAARPAGELLRAARRDRPARAAGARPLASRPTTRRSTTTRSATPGAACERPTGGSRQVTGFQIRNLPEQPITAMRDAAPLANERGAAG